MMYDVYVFMRCVEDSRIDWHIRYHSNSVNILYVNMVLRLSLKENGRQSNSPVNPTYASNFDHVYL